MASAAAALDSQQVCQYWQEIGTAWRRQAFRRRFHRHNHLAHHLIPHLLRRDQACATTPAHTATIRFVTTAGLDRSTVFATKAPIATIADCATARHRRRYHLHRRRRLHRQARRHLQARHRCHRRCQENFGLAHLHRCCRRRLLLRRRRLPNRPPRHHLLIAHARPA